MMEHAWLMQDPKASEYERLRAEFITLLNAAVTPDEATFALRIDAKQAMSALLSNAEFSQDAGTRARATDFVLARLSTCRALLLGS